ncbi:MAG: choice-of-anchor X domain-containing protein [Myxococcota bacterium]
MKLLKTALGLSLSAGLLVACSDDDTTPAVDMGTTPPVDMGTTPPADMGATEMDMGATEMDMGAAEDMGGAMGFTQPPNTVPVNFTIDDSANKSYTTADGLAWKGSFDYDAMTRILSLDTGWAAPYPPVYDDGPWNMGGHEPAGATAGDSIWGITVFVDIPTTDPVSFEYGAIAGATVDAMGAMDDGGWIWNNPGGNGTFEVAVGATDAIDTTGLVIPAWGTTDMRISIDTANMDPDFQMNFDPTMHMVEIKSSAWGWSLINMIDDGTNGDATASDGVYTFQLLPNVGVGTPRPHSGGLNSGDVAQFVLQVRGVEYKGTEMGVMGTVALTTGVTAEISTDGGMTWTAADITRVGNDNNTAITAP